MLQKIKQLEREVEKLVVDIQQTAWNYTVEIKRIVGNNNPKEILDFIIEKRKVKKITANNYKTTSFRKQ